LRGLAALLKDIKPGPVGSDLGGSWGSFLVAGGRLYFTTSVPGLDEELWVSDGTPDGTRLIKDLNPGDYPGYPAFFAADGDRVFFRAQDAEHGLELWVTDGTAEGTMLVSDTAAGLPSSDPYYLTMAGDRLFFAAWDPVHGRELWVLPLSGPGPSFRRGDSNGDGRLDVSDVLTTLSCLFLGSRALACEGAGDADDNGTLELTDAIFTIGFLFLSEPRPTAPFPDCGPDPTDDGLTCNAYLDC
jgi:ELWxxDGT repeat protein